MSVSGTRSEDDETSKDGSSGLRRRASQGISEFLLYALTTGRIRSAAKRRTGGGLAVRVGLWLRQLDARLSRDGDDLRQRVCTVGFFVALPFFAVANLAWAIALLSVHKYVSSAAPLLFVAYSALAVPVVLRRRVRSIVASHVMLALILLLPVYLHIVQGSFYNSGAALCWVTVAAPLAGILLQSRTAMLVFALLTVVVVVAAVVVADLTGHIAAIQQLRATESLTGSMQVVFSFIDVVMPSLMLLAAISYYELRLTSEQHRSEKLLYRIMPRRVAAALRAGQPRQSLVECYEGVTCVFAGVVGFAMLAETHSPSDIIAMIDTLYARMDQIAREVGVLKVATVGDAYFAVAGVPDAADPRESAARMAAFAILLRDLVAAEVRQYGILLRIGLHSGPVVAGVVGSLSPQFTLIGDTVNVASRMESNGVSGKIHCSPETHALLTPNFTFTKRVPLMTIKGKGKMQTYWLVGRLFTEPLTPVTSGRRPSSHQAQDGR
jgi:adenylate cyclase